MKRLRLIILIAFIALSLVVLSLATFFYFGLNDNYNYFTAKRDIRNGKVQIVLIGFIAPMYEGEKGRLADTAEKIIQRHFGYTEGYYGCSPSRGVRIYNSVMRAWLAKQNGSDWEIRRQQMFDSIMAAGH